MTRFKVGDRVKTVAGGFAGYIVGTFDGGDPTHPEYPWPLVRVTHAPEWPTMVGIDSTWSPRDLEHSD